SGPMAGATTAESSKDPLGDLARASGLHVRPVSLRAGWWRQGAGEPLLGQLADEGNAPVALLSDKPVAPWETPGYRLCGRGEETVRIDDQSARKLATTAWTFYRTLPDEPQKIVDLLRFCLRVKGLGREARTVLAMALFTAVLGLSIPVAAG